MGLRSKIKSKLKKVLENFSGEFSQAAPQERTPYEKGVLVDKAESPLRECTTDSFSSVEIQNS